MSAKRLIGVDIGGTSIRVALFPDPRSDRIERQEQFEVSNDYAKDLEGLLEAIKAASGGRTPEGIGVGIAGEFDEARGALHHSPHLPGWIDRPLRDDLKAAFDCPVAIVNDADAAGLAEVTFGDYREDFWLVTWGTGIGSCVVEIRSEGPYILNAEAGHHVLRWDETSPVCQCGKRGCFEAYAGGTNVEKRFGKMVSELGEADWQDVADWMGRGLYNLVRVHPVDRIVLGGGIAERQADRLPEIEGKLNEYLEGFRTIRLTLAAHGEQAGMVGAMAALRQS